MKKLVAFDLDGTLAEPKQPIDAEMGGLIAGLSRLVEIAIISGGDWPQFEAQVVGRLPEHMPWGRLHLLPTSGAKRYRFEGGKWTIVYENLLPEAARKHIVDVLARAARDTGLLEASPWGEIIEDRGSQITYSGLGQHAPLEAKRRWDPEFLKRRRLQAAVLPLLPGYAVSIGGSTSIDVTGTGIDKGSELLKLATVLGLKVGAVMFVGDALYPGGNDFSVHVAGVDTLQVRDVAETRSIIRAMSLFGDPLPSGA